jgi:copper transport protein
MDRRRAPRSGPARAGLLAIASALAGVLLVVVPLASRAGAHATLVGTSPADDSVVDAVPERVELQFDEPVEVVDGGIQVIAPDGSRADRGPVDPDDDGATLVVPIEGAGEGTYTVAWRVISEDSHNLTGSFVFHVGVETGAAELEERSSTPADATGGIGRWLGFAGAFTVIGAAVVSAAIGATTPAATTPAATSATAAAVAPARRRLRRLAVAGGVAGVLGVALTLVAQAADATGRNLVDAIGDTLDIALDNRTGTIALWRLAALVAATALAALPPVWRSPVPTALPAVAASGSLLAASISGHAWTAPNRELSVPVDVVHVVAAAVWLGGLLALVLVVRALPAGGAPPLVRRFSGLALGAVALVAVSGTVSAVVQVDSIDGLTSTGYGQLLLVKVAGFLVLVALGFVNRAVIVPKVEHALTSLLRSTRAELGVAALVLAVTAVLINQPPARSQAPSGPISLTVEAAEEVDARLQADVVPAEVGPNDIHLYFFAGDGTTPLAVDAVEITAAVGDIPPRRLDVTPVTPSHVSALDASLGTPGTWTIQVTASSAGRLATFTLEVPLR